MTDTRTLLTRITAFRQRLEAMPRLVADPVDSGEPSANLSPADALRAKAAAGSRTQAILEQSIRQLSRSAADPTPLPSHLTATARRVLTEAHELIDYMKNLADDPHLAGPPADRGGEQTDPMAIHYRETAAMMEPAVRLLQAMPDSPSVQLRLTDGLQGILSTVRQRLAALAHALDARRRDAAQVNTLAHLLAQLDRNQAVAAAPLVQLAAEILNEGPSTPLRFLDAPPAARQAFLGGPEFPAPARFVACQSLTAARVMARMVHQAPEWRERPLDPIIATLLHNVGMLRVPIDILEAPTALDGDQRRIIEMHPRAAAEVVAHRLPDFAHLVEAIASHHERVDGTGYPSGLTGERIPPLARLIAVADHYAALCCHRPQRPANDPRTALTDTLLYAEQSILDRFAAEKLLALSFYPIGSVVEMADGAVGVVAANHQGQHALQLASRPVLNLLIDGQGHMMPVPLPIDLAAQEGGAIVRTLRTDERGRRLGRHYPEWAI